MAFLPKQTLALVELEGMIPRVTNQLCARRISRVQGADTDRLTATVMHDVMSMLGGEEDDILLDRHFVTSPRSNGQVTQMQRILPCFHAQPQAIYLRIALSGTTIGVGNPSCAHHQRLQIAGDIKVEMKGLSA